jgi:hypothetical protein
VIAPEKLPEELRKTIYQLAQYGFSVDLTQLDGGSDEPIDYVAGFVAERNDAVVLCEMTTGGWEILLTGENSPTIRERVSHPFQVREKVGLWLTPFRCVP